MEYTLKLKWLTFKADLSDIDFMIQNQVDTYAVLKYDKNVVDKLFFFIVDLLKSHIEEINYPKLKKLIEDYTKQSKVFFTMDEEFVETIEVPIVFEGQDSFDSDDDDLDEEIILGA